MEEEYPSSSSSSSSFPMEKSRNLFRKSISIYLKNYHFFSTVAAFTGLPFTAAILLSQAFLPSSQIFPVVFNRLQTLFAAAGFPPSSELFTVICIKLSQTITCSVLLLPFTFSFYLMAKACVIQTLMNSINNINKQNPLYISTCLSIFITQIWNSFFILAANGSCFFLLLFAFSCMEGFNFIFPNSILFVSASGAVVYSILVANAYIISNLALVCSGMEGNGGYNGILQACILIRGKTATALTLTLPINMAMAAVEALFHYRVLRGYRNSDNITASMVLEGILIAYLYSTVLVFDTVVNCVFFRSCREDCRVDVVRIEGRNCSGNFVNRKILEDLI